MKESLTKIRACSLVLLTFLCMLFVYIVVVGLMNVRAIGGIVQPSGSTSVPHAKESSHGSMLHESDRNCW